MEKKLTFLVVSATLGDMVGIGGLAAQIVSQGYLLKSLVLFTPEDEVTRETREAEEKASGKIIGVDPFIVKGFYEGKPECDVVRMQFNISYSFHVFKPDVVICHHPIDLRQDHRLASMLTLGICFQKERDIEVFTFESSPELGRPQTLGFCPSHYVPLSFEELKIKQEMVECYKNKKWLWRDHLSIQRNRGVEFFGKETINAEAYIRLIECKKMDPRLEKIFLPTPITLPRSTGVDIG